MCIFIYTQTNKQYVAQTIKPHHCLFLEGRFTEGFCILGLFSLIPSPYSEGTKFTPFLTRGYCVAIYKLLGW